MSGECLLCAVPQMSGREKNEWLITLQVDCASRLGFLGCCFLYGLLFLLGTRGS
jgi:hypothetical protein